MRKLVKSSKKFEKAFSSFNQKQKKQFHTKLEIFLENEFDPRLRTHRLKGKRKNEFSFSVSDDIRAIYIKEIVNNQEIIIFTFIDIGSHNRVY